LQSEDGSNSTAHGNTVDMDMDVDRERASDMQEMRETQDVIFDIADQDGDIFPLEEAAWRDVARADLIDSPAGGSKVTIVEHCLAMSGRERIRLQLLLEVVGGHDSELLLEVLPPLLCHAVSSSAVDLVADVLVADVQQGDVLPSLLPAFPTLLVQ
jgi:hypothetical protein